jgi:hypothetical protein
MVGPFFIVSLALLQAAFLVALWWYCWHERGEESVENVESRL